MAPTTALWSFSPASKGEALKQSLLELVRGLLRVVFLRGSPERVHYSRRRFVVALLLAVVASAAAQWLFHSDHVVFVILRVFAELTMFMLAVVLLTARVARFRLAYVMLLLVLISLGADLLLLLVTPVFSPGLMGELATQARDYWAYGVALLAWYGGASVMAWGVRKPLQSGMLIMAGYLAAVTAVDQAFRWLYAMAAAG